MSRPDFVIIGAMKCGTSTLAAQLSAQEGVFVTTPKEPNFFSDDPIFARGMGWYEALYDGAAPGDLKGEASTHYAKAPTWPHAAERLHAAAPGAKLIYLMRDPVARLVSHYIHEWTMGKVPAGGIETALETMPELIDYSRYAMQAAPWRALYGDDNLLLLRLEDMNRDPQGTLDRVGAFLGRPGAFRWAEDLGDQNVSADRIRRFPFYELLIDHPAAAWLRRTLAPQSLRDAVKRRLQMRERPSLDDAARARIEARLTEDIAFWRAAAAKG